MIKTIHLPIELKSVHGGSCECIGHSDSGPIHSIVMLATCCTSYSYNCDLAWGDEWKWRWGAELQNKEQCHTICCAKRFGFRPHSYSYNEDVGVC